MNSIMSYFIEEMHTTEAVAGVLTKTLVKYKDIQDEFLYWLENRNFDAPDALVINGYSAKRIKEIQPSLDGSGVYNFMVTLRDSPEKAEAYIKNGFPRK